MGKDSDQGPRKNRMPIMNCDNQYLTDAEDGLLMRKSGKWAAEKLDYLHRYLDTFTTAMHGKPWRSINFIDLFCGPGKCNISETKQILLGSPLLALTLQHPFTRYFFVDNNQKIINTLKTRCASSYLASRIEYFKGDSNQMVKNIIREIEEIDKPYITDVWSSLNLAFLDPTGFQLSWETVTLLGTIERMDLIIHYPQGAFNRNMLKELEKNSPSKIDTYFGGNEWQDIYRKYQEKNAIHLHRELIDLYKEKLKSLGYIEIKENDSEPLMRNTKRKAPLYRLIFASKHPLGEKLWSQINKRDVYGQKKLPCF